MGEIRDRQEAFLRAGHVWARATRDLSMIGAAGEITPAYLAAVDAVVDARMKMENAALDLDRAAHGGPETISAWERIVGADRARNATASVVVECDREHGGKPCPDPRCWQQSAITDSAEAIAEDVRLGRTSSQIRDEIIAKVGMMASNRTAVMQARYHASVERETHHESETP